MPVYSLSAAVHAELDIKKSRFIAIVAPVPDRDAAMRLVSGLREQHRAASHVCWALMAGGQSGMSDDGEPSGTAGRPMLEVLRHHELDGVLAAVVRYYGGIKLGAGGLVRAYTDAVTAALKQAQRIEHVAMSLLATRLPYADEARVRRWIEQQGYALVDAKHEDNVSMTVQLPAADAERASGMLRDLTQGRAWVGSDV
ncbi:IMPACT family protein [Noviherbaspirillum aerium]|uniref:IMPACT family protein n=1 Tax=Noviherbaspirillum aerium TaxID=2588497 RepID=UPI001CEF8850|nr:YigZ family protein [Noviherbaspirillum aerium]